VLTRQVAPSWFTHLDEEDQQFVKRLVLASGSLKELAEGYGISYPTIRLRLDRLIDRIRSLDQVPPDDPFQARIRVYVADGDLSPRIAKELLRLHQEVSKGARK
jgi:hypothetical protein